MPFINENEYKIFSWSKKYKINSESCKNKLLQLEQFREFIWVYKAPIMIPIIILSSLISAVISYSLYHTLDYMKQITIWLSIFIYILLSIIYYLKIKKSILCDSKENN